MDLCAIAGIIGLDVPQAIIENMLRTMRRRGPDDRGVFSEESCTLLHSRLAVIDPAGGRQPMELSWQEEHYCIVYNGELYNTDEIRKELTKLGHDFTGHSDTEVVLHAYAQWKEACLHKFNGIYAFAIWESKQKRLFLARDRIGVKPLFFTHYRRGILFASEIKTLLEYPGIQPQLDREGAAQLIMFGPGRIPGSGVLKGIEELKPGYYGYYDFETWKPEQYWKLTDGEHHETFAETVEKVRWLVTDSIRRQMVSDVPVGCFLSGGLDSSIICSVCHQELGTGGETLKTFSVDYLNNAQYFQANKFQPNSDSQYIQLMQAALNSQHHWSVLTSEELIESLEDATLARDLPGMADVDFSLLAFCRQIRDHVTVALSGECADEIFGGYPWYRDPEVRSRDGFPWAQNTRERAALLSSDIRNQLNPEEFVTEAYRKTCAESDILPENSSDERRIKEMVNLNFSWFMQTLLDRKDRMSMYHALEVRVPFCDHRIAEYLYRVPWQFKDHKGNEKGLLREAMRGILPTEILFRKKSPYPKTFDPRYEERITAMFREVLCEQDSPLFSIISRKEAEALLSREMIWPWYGQLMRRPQTIAYFLQIHFWLRKYHVSLCW